MTKLTPEQVADIRATLARIQYGNRVTCVYVPTPSDAPTIPAPPPSPEALRPVRKPRTPPRVAPPCERPTTPVPHYREPSTTPPPFPAYPK